jgi:curved DNA-binding protein CbpA
MPQRIDFDPNADYYKALGVSQGATAEEIKRAYRKLAKANHRIRPAATGQRVALQGHLDAYDVLGDGKRYATDPRQSGLRHFPGSMYPRRAPARRVRSGDLFGQFFSNARGGPVRVISDFDEAPDAPGGARAGRGLRADGQGERRHVAARGRQRRRLRRPDLVRPCDAWHGSHGCDDRR